MSNHLLPEPVVPELMQEDATAENLFCALDRYLQNPELGKKLEAECRQVRGQLQLDANSQAAKAIQHLLENRAAD